jgi:hypothetical protein
MQGKFINEVKACCKKYLILEFTSDVNYPNQRNIKDCAPCTDVAVQRLYNDK